MGGGSIAIGLIPVLWTIGFNFPQILIANHASKIPIKKKLLLVTSLFQRVFWLVLGLFSFYIIQKVSIELGIIIFFVVFTLAAIGGGLNLPGWFDLISKLTPVKLRGRLFAWRVSLGALLGVLGGYVVKYLLETMPFPNNYSMIFILAFIITMISYASLFFIKEEAPSPGKGNISYKEYLKYLPVVLKENKNFRNFLIGDVIMIVAYTSFAFFTVAAIEKFSLPDSIAGEFTMIIMVSMIIGSLFFGYMADHFGHKKNILLTSVFTFIACLFAIFSTNVYMFYFVFVFNALTQALIQVSRLTIIAEMSKDDELSIYVALTNMVTVPFILTGIIAGWIVYAFSYNTLFWICAVISLFAIYWYVKKVEEPRSMFVKLKTI